MSTLKDVIITPAIGEIQFLTGSSVHGLIYLDNSKDLIFNVNSGSYTHINGGNNTAITITSDGSVGIGTTSPSNSFEVASTLILTGSNSSLYVNGIEIVNSSGSLTSQAQPNVQQSNANLTNYFLGSVGIGTTTPTEILHVNGNSLIDGDLTVTGQTLLLSASYVNITSSNVNIGDNILTLNAYSPFKKYAGIEVNDSGSAAVAQFLWDSEGNYFFVSGSTATNSQNQIILGPDGKGDLTAGALPVSYNSNELSSSIIYQAGSKIGIDITPTGDAKLQVYNTSGNYNAVFSNSGQATVEIKGGEGENARLRLIPDEGDDVTNADHFQLIHLASNNDFALQRFDGADWDSHFVLDVNGNVGIGENINPISKLHVIQAGTGEAFRVDGASSEFAMIIEGGTSYKTKIRGGVTIGNNYGSSTPPSNGLLVEGSVGIGTTSPSEKLHVNGNVKGDSFGTHENTTARIFSPEGAAFNGTSSSHTGYLILKFPDNGSAGYSNMMTGVIRVFDYDWGESFDVHFAGYWYSGNEWTRVTGWIDSQANQDRNFTIRFGRMTGSSGSDDRPFITIGESTSTWAYVKFSLISFTASHGGTNLENWNSGWETSVGTGLPGTSLTTRTNTQSNNWRRNGAKLFSNFGYVGIGTTDPTAQLEISSSSASSLLNVKGPGGDGMLYVSGSVFGRVGINTTNPISNLHVTNPGPYEASIALTGNGANQDTWVMKSEDDSNGSAILNFRDEDSFTTALTLKQDGNVGIGTDSPTANLEVAGLNATTGPVIRLSNNSPSIGAGGTHGTIEFYSGDTSTPGAQVVSSIKSIHVATFPNFGELAFSTNSNNEAVRIDLNGNVGIGTTSPTAQLEISSSSASSLLNVNGAGGDNILYVSGSGYVGIGTTSPVRRLHVVESSVTEVARLESASSTGGSWLGFHNSSYNLGYFGWGTTSNNNLFIVNYQNAATLFYTNGTEKVRIAASGNVGIGTVSPGSKLTVDSGDIKLQGSRSGDADIESIIWHNTNSTGFDVAKITGKTGTNIYEGILRFETKDSGGTMAERMRIDSSGNVGIGTTSPDNKLHVRADGNSSNGLKVSNDSTGTSARTFLSLYNNSDSAAGFILPGSNYTAISGWANRLVINTDSGISNGIMIRPATGGFKVSASSTDANDFFVSTSGNVGIGTTSPSNKLQVAGRGYFGPVGTGDATTKALMDTYSVLKLKPHDSNSTNMTFAQVNNGSGIGIQVTNSTQTADWDIALNPFGGNVGIGTINPTKKLHVSGDTLIDGDLTVTGQTLLLSASYVNITSSNVNIGDNIITLNAQSPFKKYAGIEMNDSGSSAVAQFLWDSEGNYFFVSGSTATNSQNQILLGPDGKADLTAGALPVSYNSNELSSSIVYQAGDKIGIGTTAPDFPLEVAGAIGIDDYIYHNGDHNTYIQFNSDAILLRTGGQDRLKISNTETVINDDTLGHDFRVEGDTDTALFVADASTDRVGIGIGVPGSKLHVQLNNQSAYSTSSSSTDHLLIRTQQNTGTSGAYSSLRMLASSNDGINNAVGIINLVSPTNGNNDSAFTFQLRDSSSVYGEKVRIQADGNVGIGTTSPDHKLQVNGTVSIRPNGSSNDQHYFTTGGANNTQYIMYDSAGTAVNRFRTDNYSYINGGNVGIGTSIPNQALHVVGNFLLENNKEIRQKDSGGTERTIVELDSSNDLNIGGSYAGALKFIGGGSYSEVMRIHDDGNVGIGTTSPVARLEIQQVASDQSGAAALKVVGTAYGTNKTIHSYMGTTSNTKSLFYAENSNGVVMNISGNGDVGIGVSPSTRLHVSNPAVGQSGNAVTSITTTQATNLGVKLSFTGGANSDGNIIGGIALGNGGEEYAGLYAIDGGSSAATDLAFFVGDTNGINEAVHIDSGGTVQINSPAAAGTRSLTVKLTDNTSGTVVFEQASNEYFRINTTNNAEEVILGNTTTNPDIVFKGYGSGTVTGTATQKLAVDSSGNVIETEQEKSLSTTGGTIDTGFTADQFTMLEVIGYINPNSAGSANYKDPVHIFVYNGVGWNGSAVTNYIYSSQMAPLAREIYSSGSSVSGNEIEAVFLTGSTESDDCPNSSASSYQVRLKISNYNQAGSSGFTVKVIKRY